jgi:hypothetical protein
VVQLLEVQLVKVFFLVRIIQRFVQRIVHAGKQRNDKGVVQWFEWFVKRDQLRPFHWTFWRTPIIPEP